MTSRAPGVKGIPAVPRSFDTFRGPSIPARDRGTWHAGPARMDGKELKEKSQGTIRAAAAWITRQDAQLPPSASTRAGKEMDAVLKQSL